MKLKTLILTVAVLAVLSAIAYWTNRPPAAAAADPRVGQPLADAAALSRATEVRLTDQGKTVRLVRQADGSWRDASYFDLPADFSKLSGLTGDLAAAKLQRLVTANPERIARLDFNGTRIEFLDPAGQPLWAVNLGRNPDSGGRFVRFGDEAKAYLADFNSPVDADAKGWADATLLALKPDEVRRIEIPFDAGGPVIVSRTKAADPWTSDRTPAGKTLKADTVASVATTLGSLRFSDTSDPADPLVAAARGHLRPFVLTTFDGKTYTVALGRQPEKKKPQPAGPPPAPAPGAATPPAPADTIPAGPVYAFVTSSDPQAPINRAMAKRAFQIDDYSFTNLPQKPDDLFEGGPAAPTPAANPPPP
jgi:hypothetical protein